MMRSSATADKRVAWRRRAGARAVLLLDTAGFFLISSVGETLISLVLARLWPYDCDALLIMAIAVLFLMGLYGALIWHMRRRLVDCWRQGSLYRWFREE